MALLRIRRHSPDTPPFQILGSVGSYPVSAFLAIAGLLALFGLNVMALLGLA